MTSRTDLPPLLERLHTQLHDLGLHEADALVEGSLERAAKEAATYADFLCGLLAEELAARNHRALTMRMQLAGLPRGKTLASFDFAFQPSVDERVVRELATLRFVTEASNVILLGPPGVGKTHLAAGLAAEAVRGGFSAYFTTAHDLTSTLGRAAREGKLEARMKTYLRPRVLVLDEVGYLPLDEVGANLLFQLISARYEKGSILLTSNKSYGQWGAIFGETTIAAALLDRLLHHSTTLNIRGDSYRLKDRKRAGLLNVAPPAPVEVGEGSTAGAPRSYPNALRKETSPMRLKATYDGVTVKLPNGAGEMEDLGSLMSGRALSGLVRVRAFIYEAEEGRISVRLECKVRGSSAGYWFAYKRWRGKLLKMYLGEAYALDPYVLDRVARRLLGDPG